MKGLLSLLLGLGLVGAISASAKADHQPAAHAAAQGLRSDVGPLVSGRSALADQLVGCPPGRGYSRGYRGYSVGGYPGLGYPSAYRSYRAYPGYGSYGRGYGSYGRGYGGYGYPYGYGGYGSGVRVGTRSGVSLWIGF